MTTEITATNQAAIDDAATYDLFSIDNLRTGLMHQYAVISGQQLRGIFARSTDSRRILARVAN